MNKIQTTSFHKYRAPLHWVPITGSPAERNVKASQNRGSQSEEPWTVVTRKGKGKVVKPKAAPGYKSLTTNPPMGSRDTQGVLGSQNGNDYCFEVGDTSPSVHVEEPNHACPSRIAEGPSNILISNSFSGLIPYVYNKDGRDHLDDGTGLSHDEDLDEIEEKGAVIDDYVEDVITSPISNRQKKKAAKILHSGSRPKGRHRA